MSITFKNEKGFKKQKKSFNWWLKTGSGTLQVSPLPNNFLLHTLIS